MNRAILFDLDGTLTDPAEGIIGSIQYACAEMGIGIPEYSTLLCAIGPPIHTTLARLLDTDDAELVQRAVTLYRERYASRGMLSENRIYPGIEEMLRRLNGEGYRLFVATSKPRVYAACILRHFKLDRYFRAVYGSDLDGTRADKAELLAYIIGAEGLASPAAVMVGDRMHDIVGARRNGLRSVGVTYGYGSESELVEAGADALCATVPDLTANLTGQSG